MKAQYLTINDVNLNEHIATLAFSLDDLDHRNDEIKDILIDALRDHYVSDEIKFLETEIDFNYLVNNLMKDGLIVDVLDNDSNYQISIKPSWLYITTDYLNMKKLDY